MWRELLPQLHRKREITPVRAAVLVLPQAALLSSRAHLLGEPATPAQVWDEREWEHVLASPPDLAGCEPPTRDAAEGKDRRAADSQPADNSRV